MSSWGGLGPRGHAVVFQRQSMVWLAHLVSSLAPQYRAVQSRYSTVQSSTEQYRAGTVQSACCSQVPLPLRVGRLANHRCHARARYSRVQNGRTVACCAMQSRGARAASGPPHTLTTDQSESRVVGIFS
eukprot:1173383-Prorocentrum_minimum.AAC.1